jgi:hypothetical protein
LTSRARACGSMSNRPARSACQRSSRSGRR